jgi:hypothetical protein
MQSNNLASESNEDGLPQSRLTNSRGSSRAKKKKKVKKQEGEKRKTEKKVDYPVGDKFLKN